MSIYTITDWLGLVPIFVCLLFGGVGLVQLITRRNLFKVDCDIILLGIYYIIVIFGYVIEHIISPFVHDVLFGIIIILLSEITKALLT